MSRTQCLAACSDGQTPVDDRSGVLFSTGSARSGHGSNQWRQEKAYHVASSCSLLAFPDMIFCVWSFSRAEFLVNVVFPSSTQSALPPTPPPSPYPRPLLPPQHRRRACMCRSISVHVSHQRPQAVFRSKQRPLSQHQESRQLSSTQKVDFCF